MLEIAKTISIYLFQFDKPLPIIAKVKLEIWELDVT